MKVVHEAKEGTTATYTTEAGKANVAGRGVEWVGGLAVAKANCAPYCASTPCGTCAVNFFFGRGCAFPAGPWFVPAGERAYCMGGLAPRGKWAKPRMFQVSHDAKQYTRGPFLHVVMDIPVAPSNDNCP